LKRLPALFEIPAPDAERARRRIELMERNVMLPAKCFFIGTIFYSFYRNSLWVGNISSTQDVVVETMQIIFWFYVPLCALLALPILFSRRLPLAVLQWTVVTSSLVDGLLVACMSVITGGMDSILYWLFVGLILRNAASIPPGFSQLFLNFAISMCYVLVAMLNSTIIANLDDATIKAMDLSPNEGLGESFLLRLLVLWLTTISCHGAQAFVEKQHVVAAEAEEFAVRENQLRAAGRLAAEFAHQIKNPLAIISNSAHSLQRSARENKPASLSQIEIIQEEVARADRVITQIMGYAQLSEGRVEKLNVVEEFGPRHQPGAAGRHAHGDCAGEAAGRTVSPAADAARAFLRDCGQPAAKRARGAGRSGEDHSHRRLPARSFRGGDRGGQRAGRAAGPGGAHF